MERYFGKYPAIVVGTEDPAGLGGIRVRVPDRFGNQTIPVRWAPVYVPGGVTPQPPPVGTQVLIEFLAGDPDTPVWCGHFLPDVADIEREPAPADDVVRLSAGASSLTLSPDGVTLALGDARLTISQQQITLTAPAIALDGQDVGLGEGAQMPLVNGSALLALFNSHAHRTHPLRLFGAATSAPPSPPLTPEVFLTKVKGA